MDRLRAEVDLHVRVSPFDERRVFAVQMKVEIHPLQALRDNGAHAGEAHSAFAGDFEGSSVHVGMVGSVRIVGIVGWSFCHFDRSRGVLGWDEVEKSGVCTVEGFLRYVLITGLRSK